MPTQLLVPGLGQFPNVISLSALNGANGFELDGVSAGDYSGYSVSTAGDVNHDGIADIIIGAYGANSNAGKTYVVFGKASGWTSPISLSALNGANGFELDGVSSYDHSGYSVSAAGDVNYDGIADVIIGANNANSAAGKTYVVFGKTSSWTSPISLGTLNGVNGFELDGVSNYDNGGWSVSTAGDVNNDGIADIIIGAPVPGKTYVVFGKAGGWTSPISLSTLNGANGFELDGVSANDGSGCSISAAGDINNDGIADIIIGACVTNSAVGKTYVVFGKASGWTSPISLGTLNGVNGFELDRVLANDSGDCSVSAVGDVNNDGIADIIIGAPGANSITGKTYVVFGDSPPVLANNSLTIGAGCTVTLDSTYLAAYDLNHANSTLTFMASNVANGNFQKNVLGVVTPLTTPFLQSDVTAGYIQFVSTNSNAPSYSMTVSSSGLAFVPATPVVVSFTAPSCSGAPTQAPSAVPSFAPSSSEASSAVRTSPAWFLPINQVFSLLDSSIPTAYHSVSGYLSGLDASSGSVTHNTPYSLSSLETVGTQLMLGAVVLKLAQKGINWVKGFWTSEPTLKPNAKPVLSEAKKSLQMQGTDTVSQSATKDLACDMKHLSEKMETYQACLEETSAQNANVVYPNFQKPGINFAYSTVARKNMPSVAQQTVITNSTRPATLGC